MNLKYDKNTGRQSIFDIIKGICIIFVIITHYGWSEKQQLIGLFPYITDMAVPTFMLLTGYLFSASYISKGIQHFEDAYDLTLIVNRILRYTIPFLIAYIIEIIYFGLRQNNFELMNVITTFFTGGIGPGSYYYPLMIQITFFLPVILFSIKNSPIAGLIFWFLFNAFFEFIQTIIGLDPEIYRLSIFRYSFLLAFGCFIYLRREKKINTLFLLLSFATGFIFILVTKYLGYRPKFINNIWYGTSFMSALYIAPIIMLIIYKPQSVSFRPLELLGKSSYNIFLTQLVYYSTVSYHVAKITSITVLQLMINIIICSTSGILFYLLEKKITDQIIKCVSPVTVKLKEYLRK